MRGSNQTHDRAIRSRWRIARMTAVLLLLGLIQAGAQLTAQTVTLSANKMPLEQVCKEIEKQTGYFFVYAKDLQKSQTITVQLKNEEVKTALEKVFDRSNLKYEVIGKVVSVNTKKKAEAAEARTEAQTDTMNIYGAVITEKGPLENVSVTTSKSKKSALTDINGTYQIKGVLTGEDLIFSYVGYTPLRRKVGKERQIVVGLQVADNELDKVVVKAYGTTSRRYSTSSIVSVSGKEIENIPVQNPMLALAGRVPGLVVQAASGEPMAPVRVEIRGRNSINPNFPTDPLYVIDGVPQTVMNISSVKNSDKFPTMMSNGLNQSDVYNVGGGISPLFGLNPYDIQSIEILQDAGATAVYGSRGANGVILITTKRGKAGRTSVNVNMSQGVTYVSKFYDMLDIREYVAMRKEAIANDGFTPSLNANSLGYAPDLLLWDTTRNVDWQRYLYGNPGLYSSVSTALSGGNDQMTFRLSGAYSRTKDIKAVSGINQSLSLNGALDYKSINKKFTMKLNLMMVNGISNSVNQPIGNTLPPNAPEPFDSLGNLNYAGYSIWGSMPFSSLKNSADTRSAQMNSSIELSYNLFKGLNLGAALRTRKSTSDVFNITPVASKDPMAMPISRQGTNYKGNTEIKGLVIEPYISYGMTLGNGALDMTLRGTYEHNKTSALTVQGSNYTTDDLIRSIKDAPTKDAKDRYGEYKYTGGMFALNYRLNHKPFDLRI
ncbi:MAG: TonB-dependent receptor plug domain-containing protein, partial [Chitinophagaceae bacterium]|nr:TonB-dependent receptor plug domain-containing protein [Chitinophagaceae bacterium]